MELQQRYLLESIEAYKGYIKMLEGHGGRFVIGIGLCIRHN